MASRTIVLLEDDVDGSKADETIEFGIDGTTYAIDLSNSNATKLRGALDGYINKARKVSGKRSTSRNASSESTSKRSVHGLPPTASSSPAAVLRAWYSSSTVTQATEARQTKSTAPLVGRFLVSTLTFSSAGNYIVPRHGPRQTVPTERPQDGCLRQTPPRRARIR